MSIPNLIIILKILLRNVFCFSLEFCRFMELECISSDDGLKSHDIINITPLKQPMIEK